MIFGARKKKRVADIIKGSELFALLYGLFVMVILMFFGRNIALLFSTNQTVVDTVQVYLLIVPVGYGLQGLFLIYTSTLNGINKPLHSALISLLRLFALYIPLALLASGLWGLTGIWIALNLSFLAALAVCKHSINRLLPASIKD